MTWHDMACQQDFEQAERLRLETEENHRVLALTTLGGFNLDAYVLLPFVR